MQEHEKRVIEEQKELEVKIKALQDFIENNDKYLSLSPFVQRDMRDQLNIMEQYFQILGRRIRRFS